ENIRKHREYALEQALEQDDTSLSEDELDEKDVKAIRAKSLGSSSA
nr:hypothetical protein [Tanacetum cinerariifolium]